MNEHDVEQALAQLGQHSVLGSAAYTLDSLVRGVNACSDGWPYWSAPRRASAPLQQLLTDAQQLAREGREPAPQDAAKRLKAAYVQLRRFRTRHPNCRFTIHDAPGVPGDDAAPAAGQQAQATEPRRLVVRVRAGRAEVLVLGSQPLPPGKYVGAAAVTDRRKGDA
jgi:hypothetical protein